MGANYAEKSAGYQENDFRPAKAWEKGKCAIAPNG
jgi:hypothetical protein